MVYDYFSYNGKLLPSRQAVIPLDNIEYAYGFGVYETIRFSHGTAYFLQWHSGRLLASAKTIGLDHSFPASFIAAGVEALITKNGAQACNVKVLLIGGKTRQQAKLFIQCLPPLFQGKKLYKSGVHLITYRHERDFPRAKTLNMLPSYLAYRQAQQSDAYDALFINRSGGITEGSRTNFLCLGGQTIFSPPEEAILPGIMRRAVLDFAQKNGFSVARQPIRPEDLAKFEAAFVTSTTSKILPVKSIDTFVFGIRPPALLSLMQQFGAHLESMASSGKIQT